MPAFNWNTEMLDLFWHWISERQKVFYRRRVLRQPPPWTSDDVIAGYHFTNVYRELDPGTIWIIQNVLENNRIHACERTFLTLAYRLFGTESVFEFLGINPEITLAHPMMPHNFDEKWVADSLQELMDSGKQAFTSAYMVSNYGRSEPKSVVIADILNRAATGWSDTWRRIVDAKSRVGAFEALQSVHGIGKFIAFQTLVDLSYPLAGGRSTLGFHNNDWVMAGPGAERGLKLLLGETFSTAKGKDNAAIAALVEMQHEPLAALEMPWLLNARNEPVPVDRSNIQNCLCEFSKYIKLLREHDGGKKTAGRKRVFSCELAHQRDTEFEGKPHSGFSKYAIQVDAFI